MDQTPHTTDTSMDDMHSTGSVHQNDMTKTNNLVSEKVDTTMEGGKRRRRKSMRKARKSMRKARKTMRKGRKSMRKMRKTMRKGRKSMRKSRKH